MVVLPHTGGGYTESHASHHIPQYATMVRPRKGVTAVCGSSIFVWETAWEDDLWLPPPKGLSYHPLPPASLTLFQCGSLVQVSLSS